jgi:collagen type IV alpha-3-binding protein
MTVIETIADDTLVFLQVHKRIWPASQRDSLFWSHMRQVPDHNDRDGHDIWIVCNHSTENPDFPVSSVSQCCCFPCNLDNLSYFRAPGVASLHVL